MCGVTASYTGRTTPTRSYDERYRQPLGHHDGERPAVPPSRAISKKRRREAISTTHRRLRRNGRATSASCTQVELPILPGGTSACGCSLMTLALSGSGLPQAEAARLSSSNRKTVADQVKTGATGLFPREEMTVYVDGTHRRGTRRCCLAEGGYRGRARARACVSAML